MSKINKFKWTYGLFGHNYRVAALSRLYLTVLEIIICMDGRTALILEKLCFKKGNNV